MSPTMDGGTRIVDGETFFRETQTEREFQAAIVEEAEMRGWLVFHDEDSRKNRAGFPDLCMVRGGRLVFAELKRELPAKCSPSMLAKLTPTHEQQRWLDELTSVAHRITGASVLVYLWRPSDWPEIERVLS